MTMQEFNEKAYLEANPDVNSAVLAGGFASGRAHWELYGKNESRPLFVALTRTQRLLAGLDIGRLSGVEIGPLASPLVQKSQGNILYVDYADAQYLKERYKKDPNVDINRIVEVDAIWGQNSLREIIGADRHIDYVLASHVVEHVPDLVTWLSEVRSILARSGSLRLAVPDKRYTFDYKRDISKMPDVLDAFVRKARAPLPRMILDFCMSACTVDVAKAWDGLLDGSKLPRMYTDAGALAIARSAFDEARYHDVHCWVFTPLSFVELMIRLAELDFLGLACDEIIDTQRYQLEFYVAMKVEDNQQSIIESWKRAARALSADA